MNLINSLQGTTTVPLYGNIVYDLSYRYGCFYFLANLSWAIQTARLLKDSKNPDTHLNWEAIKDQIVNHHKDYNLKELQEYCMAQLLIQQL